ncbi:hypothetical protein BOKEGFJH_00186 [Chlamydia avium]|uniref:Phosphorylase superfamily protein n=1 Tax=Chlamydia avium 10DC88 TaxID=1229831 RepID=W8JFT8_9CHLA|nr:hypothetical protein [Chlamydia avium]AHK63060.1 Uncharacterized protein M832_01910 [Chlamydia avium 10DC88]VVT42675.1 hypothetical protein BOKEGFJH_00186 [Chlamydia avium]
MLFKNYPNTQAPSNYIRLLFIFADMCEAEAIINKYPFQKQKNNFYTCWDANHSCLMDILLLQQWGRQGVISSLNTELLSNYHACLNIGFAGTSSFLFPLHSCYSIDRVAELSSENPQTLSHQPELELISLSSLPLAHLVSSPTPYRYGMHDYFQLIDMEGYTISQLCKKQNLPCMMIKIVSDYTTPEGGEYIKNNKHALAETLYTTLKDSMDSIRSLVTSIHH